MPRIPTFQTQARPTAEVGGVQTGIQITTENKQKYNNITEVSFMIFRTGSVLIVGMCDEHILHDIYYFLKALLKTEFKSICQKLILPGDLTNKNKKKKIRRKTIHIVTGIDLENIVQDTNTKFIEPISMDLIEIDNTPNQEILIPIVETPKKERKPRKSKKDLELEIIDEV